MIYKKEWVFLGCLKRRFMLNLEHTILKEPTMKHSQFPSVTVVQHPLAQHNLAVIRDKNARCDIFKSAFNRLASILLIEAMKVLPLKSEEIETPLMKTSVQKVDSDYTVLFVPILRAGLGLSESALNLFPDAKVCHIGMYRDEKTFCPVWYYDKSPAQFDNPDKIKVFILDPMLATGGSALAAVELMLKKGILSENIVFVSVLSAPEGLQKLSAAYPGLQIVTTAIDDKLNERAYIMPGLGDAGDRLFNTDN